MMDIQNTITQTQTHAQTKPKAIDQNKDQALFMREQSDRLAGSSPEWRSARSAREESVFRLSEAARNPDERNSSPYVQSFKGYMVESVPKEEAFGVGDMVDMVNPLHHLPLVGPLYRNMTGDQINPAGRVIGGTLFGGALGTASGIANVIAEEETGQDIPGLVGNSMRNDEAQRAYQQAMQQHSETKTFDNTYRHEKPQYNE